MDDRLQGRFRSELKSKNLLLQFEKKCFFIITQFWTFSNIKKNNNKAAWYIILAEVKFLSHNVTREENGIMGPRSEIQNQKQMTNMKS